MKKARKPTVPSPSADPQPGNERRLSKRALALKEELRWTPTPAEARRRMKSRPGFLDKYTEEEIEAMFSGALDHNL